MCPPNVLTTTSSPSYDDIAPSQNNNDTSNATPVPSPSSTVLQSVVTSQPGNPRPLRVAHYDQVTTFFLL